MKSIFRNIVKVIGCVPVLAWVHILTVLVMSTVVSLGLCMLLNPEFAKVVFGILLALMIIGFVIYLLWHVYVMVFDLICEFIGNWIE